MITNGCYILMNNGKIKGPMTESPMWDNVFFSPDGYLWEKDGCMLGWPADAMMSVSETFSPDVWAEMSSSGYSIDGNLITLNRSAS